MLSLLYGILDNHILAPVNMYQLRKHTAHPAQSVLSFVKTCRHL